MAPHTGIRFFYRDVSPDGDMSPIHQRLNRHGAVHQADAGVGGVAVYTGVGQRGA
ncbi:MAG: hypothetical protein J5741_02530 [Bacteroidales bacterium]|nr:hypothetical protein [Bacteroidales bacterium]